MQEIYSRLGAPAERIVVTDNETAEMIKLVSNAMLALRVSYVNEVANLCDKVGVDVTDVVRALGMDRRIGPAYLQPGPGFGGSCLPKDVRAMGLLAKDHDCGFRLVEAVADVNVRQKISVVKRAEAFFGSLRNKKVAVLGLAFKADTDDVRESPSLSIIKGLLDAGAQVSVYDPAAADSARKFITGVTSAPSAEAACRDVSLAIIATEWDEFRETDWMWFKEVMAEPNVFDTRNILDLAQLREIGFSYLTIGRGAHQG
jgi:UDPglucose 6-dehydrogenase